MDLQDLLQREYLGNSAAEYAVATLTFVVVVAGFLLGRRLLLARLRALAARTTTDLDDFFVELLGLIKSPECYFVGFFIATRPLSFDAKVDHALRSAVILVVAYRALTMLTTASDYGVRKALAGADGDPARVQTARTVGILVRAVLWTGAAIFVLDNLGINVNSMLAGLGIGGVAVALAAQAVLGDLFSALAIFLDRPFVVGDFIIVGESMGTVEHIGVKTTRVRALSGELLVISNSTLTSSRIRNFKRMQERRVVFRFGLVYATPEPLLAEAPAIVKRLVEADPLLRFDRAHFMNFGDSSLDFEVVYYMRDPDYNKYMDSHQRLLLGIVREFRAKGMDFAFPTRTVVVEGGLPAKA